MKPMEMKPSEQIPDEKPEIEDLFPQYDNVEVDEKKPRGKAKKIKEEEQRKKEFTDSLQGVGSLLLNIVIARLPNPSPLNDVERTSFDAAFTKVAYKYSNILGNYQEETALALISLMIFIPRIRKPKESETENEKTS